METKAPASTVFELKGKGENFLFENYDPNGNAQRIVLCCEAQVKERICCQEFVAKCALYVSRFVAGAILKQASSIISYTSDVLEIIKASQRT